MRTFDLWLEQRDRIFFYASKEPLEVGAEIRPWDTRDGRPAIKKAEAIFEEVRRQVAPDAPSRVGCVFVSPSPSWKSVERPYLYRVAVTGKTWTVDSAHYGEATYALDGYNEEEGTERAADSAKRYWRRRPYLDRMMRPETIVQGKVVVISQVVT